MKRTFAGLLALGALGAAGAAALPATAGAADRSLELVSPVDNGGFSAQGWGWPDGEHAVFQLGLSDPSPRIARRTPSGWISHQLPIVGSGVAPTLRDASDDMSRQIVSEASFFTIEGFTEGLYLHEQGRPIQTIASWPSPPADGTIHWSAIYVGRNSDASEILLQARPGYLDAPVSDTGLYRWHDGGEVDPIDTGDARIATCRAVDPANAGAMLGSQDATSISSAVPSLLQSGASADTRTLALTTRQCDSGAVQSHVLVWRDGATVDVSVPLDNVDRGARFIGMAQDGSSVFFVSASRLLADDVNSASDLFRYDVASGGLTRVSAGTPGSDPGGLTGQMVSPDGSHAWFSTQSSIGGHGTDRGGNLFVWSQQAGLRLAATAATSWPFRLDGVWNGIGQVQISYDGSAIAFTADDATIAPGSDTGGLEQIWRIGADGAVLCVSCRRDGVAPTTAATLGTEMLSQTADFAPPRMSRDGSVLIFESAEPLVAADVNGVADVYALIDGRVELISTGTDQFRAGLEGVSWDGKSIFFRSFGSLVPESQDSYAKLYVSRAGGSGRAPSPPAPCSGDGCQPPPTTPPSQQVPGSETFSGRGDAVAAPLLSLNPVGATARRRFAKSGSLTVVAESTSAVRLTATLRVLLGGRWVTVGRAGRTLAGEGSARLTVRLSKRARQRLARSGSLRVRVDLTAPGAVGRRANIVLKSTKKTARTRPVRR